MPRIIVNDPVEEFIYKLQKPTIAKVLKTIELLEQFGYQLGMPHAKKIRLDLFELRVRGIQEVRILYTFKDQKIHLIHAFVKKTQKTPPKEIDTALKQIKLLDPV